MLSPLRHPAWRGAPAACRRAAAALAVCRRGVAAVEFALVAPVMILLFIGVFDIAHAMIVQQEVYNCTHAILVSASSLSLQPDKTTSLTPLQVQQSLSTVFAAISGRRNGALLGATGVIMTSVDFTQSDPSCTSSCAYVAHTAWSVAYADPAGRSGGANTFESATRPCQLNQTTPTQAAPGRLDSIGTWGIMNPDPMLIVDTHYRYTPMFFNFVTGPIDFWSTGYWPIRSFDPNVAVTSRWTRYDIANLGTGGAKCLGYP